MTAISRSHQSPDQGRVVHPWTDAARRPRTPTASALLRRLSAAESNALARKIARSTYAIRLVCPHLNSSLLLAAPVFGHRTAELGDDGLAEFGGDDAQRWGGRYELS